MKMLRECCCKCCCCRCCVCCSDLFTCTDAVVAATVDDGKKSKNRLVAFRIFILKQWENLLLKMIFQNSVSFRIMLLRTMMKIAFRIMSHYRVVRGIMSFTAISYIFMLFGIVIFGILWVYCGFYGTSALICESFWSRQCTIYKGFTVYPFRHSEHCSSLCLFPNLPTSRPPPNFDFLEGTACRLLGLFQTILELIESNLTAKVSNFLTFPTKGQTCQSRTSNYRGGLSRCFLRNLCSDSE